MSFKDWDTLKFGIQRGECILFLGPGLPVDGENGTPLATPDSLADQLIAGLPEEDATEVRGRSLSKITRRFLSSRGDIPLEMELLAWHEKTQAFHSELHDALAELPFQRIITSSHDAAMEAALRRAGKTPTVEHYNYRDSGKDLLPEPSEAEPLLYHLYGHASAPHSVVLTETQLLDFLAALIAKAPPLPSDLTAALRRGRMFLFLGFELQQWYLRILLHVLKVLSTEIDASSRSRTNAFVAETLDGEEPPVGEDTILFYSNTFTSLQVYPQDASGFIRELRERYGPVASAGGSQTADGSAPAAKSEPDAPTVFLCHASENAQKAKEIHDALKQFGLRPWLDKEALRGGDDWNDQIETTIDEVDYFVVLHSEALVAKARDRAYVVKEIKAALRAAEMTFNAFIIPVLIDDTPLLPQLDHNHAVDLRKENGMQKLIRAIKREARTV